MSVRQPIRLRYNDLISLDEELAALFPERNYSVELEMGEVVMNLPRMLVPDEISRINSKQRHYQKRSDRRR